VTKHEVRRTASRSAWRRSLSPEQDATRGVLARRACACGRERTEHDRAGRRAHACLRWTSVGHDLASTSGTASSCSSRRPRLRRLLPRRQMTCPTAGSARRPRT
jgi:hypothetical protein